jgi:mycothiol synthase
VTLDDNQNDNQPESATAQPNGLANSSELTNPFELSPVNALSSVQAAAVRTLVANAPGSADNPPLSERALLHLQSGEPIKHLVIHSSETVLGYAQLEPEAESTSAISIELVTAVEQAGELTRALLAAIVDQTDGAPLRLWAHGSASPVHAEAPAVGFSAARRLFQLRRALPGEPDLSTLVVDPPPDVLIRPFIPGRDDARWLAVNAAAFAHHPEQGGWTQADLDDRMRSSWFDPAGFLVAMRGEQMLGYHWTKVHTDGDEPTGEVYVLGVDPAAQGMALGKVLLTAGLVHLQQQGLRTVLLYVDESNTQAVQLYRKLTFMTFSTDVQYARG